MCKMSTGKTVGWGYVVIFIVYINACRGRLLWQLCAFQHLPVFHFLPFSDVMVLEPPQALA